MKSATRVAAALSIIVGAPALGFQLAPLGHQSEARHTKETSHRIVRVAGELGVLLKEPVHEEITQLAFNCPVGLDRFPRDRYCATSNEGSASPMVIYGVRWNDIPPFKLFEKQGQKCKKLWVLNVPACKTDQTIRLLTQPDCWYCLFQDAAEKAKTKRITGCVKGPNEELGNLMTRSHFGDLQFLHAMADGNGVAATDTRKKILEWIEFAWRVFTRNIKTDIFLKDIEIDTIRTHFGCSDWKVADIYVQGQTEYLLPKIDHIAFGSILHTLQDSFARGHTARELPHLGETCGGEPQLGKIAEFHSYQDQHPGKHDDEDERGAFAGGGGDWPSAVHASRRLTRYFEDRVPWESVKTVIECLFELSDSPRPSSPGEFKRTP